MKAARRVLGALLAFLLVAALSSCSLSGLTLGPGETNKPRETARQGQPNSEARQSEAEARKTERREVPPSDYENAFFDQLSPNEAALYTAIWEANPGEKVQVDLPEPYFMECGTDGNPTEEASTRAGTDISRELKTALVALWLDQPLYFWGEIGLQGNTFEYKTCSTSGGNMEITTLSFTAGVKEIYKDDPLSMKVSLDAYAAAVPVTGETTAEKVASIAEYLCDHTEYDYEGVSPSAHDAMGVLHPTKGGVAVCEGYSRAFQLLCQKNGISCVVMIGDGVTSDGTEGHMWNLVKLDDGHWYGVDVTWCDTAKTLDYFLVGRDTTAFDHMKFSESHRHNPAIGDEARVLSYPSQEYSAYDPEAVPEPAPESAPAET